MAVIGIDLGTTNSLVTTYKEGKTVFIPNQFQKFLTPSVVSIDEEGKIIVGEVAKERLVTAPFSTVSLFKRDMGSKKIFILNEKEYLPEEISALVIKQLVKDAEEYLQETVEEAIISVPAYFDAKQRAATKLAGKMAGIKVERLINEPSAAAIACREEEEEVFIVFDFGGGTLDVSIVECFFNVISICAISGDNYLGGREFDMEIVKYFCKQNTIYFLDLTRAEKESLLRIAEKAKVKLQEQSEVTIEVHFREEVLLLHLTNDILFSISGDIFAKIKRPIRNAINDSGLRAEDIDKCILVGGSCHMGIVQEYLRDILNVDVVNATDIDQTIAKGLGISTGIKMREAEVKSLLLTDICPFSLGIGIHNRENTNHPLMCPIIPRNTVLPASITKRFYTNHLGQAFVDSSIYQGEAKYVKDNLLLDEREIEVPINHSIFESFDITFSYDINAILAIRILINSTGEEKLLSLTGNGLAVDDMEIAQQIERIKKMELQKPESKEYQLLMERVNRMYQETTGELQEEVERVMIECENIRNHIKVNKVTRDIKMYNELLNEIEEKMNQSGIFKDEYNNNNGFFS